jgi:hypothetical protein
MTNSPQTPEPTAKQLRYLRHLASSRGQTFTPPTTRAEASAQIERLKSRRADSSWERRSEAFVLGREIDDRWGPATGARRHEIEGYGSTARWKR